MPSLDRDAFTARQGMERNGAFRLAFFLLQNGNRRMEKAAEYVLCLFFFGNWKQRHREKAAKGSLISSYTKTTIQQGKQACTHRKTKKEKEKTKRRTKACYLLPDAASVEERRSTAATSANDDASMAAERAGPPEQQQQQQSKKPARASGCGWSSGATVRTGGREKQRNREKEGRKEGRTRAQLVARSFQILAGIYDAGGVPASQRVQLLTITITMESERE